MDRKYAFIALLFTTIGSGFTAASAQEKGAGDYVWVDCNVRTCQIVQVKDVVRASLDSLLTVRLIQVTDGKVVEQKEPTENIIEYMVICGNKKATVAIDGVQEAIPVNRKVRNIYTAVWTYVCTGKSILK